VCVLCGELWTEYHWSEITADEVEDAPDCVVAFEVHVARRGRRLRERAVRTRLVGVVLGGYGLQLQDWEGSSYILRDRKGKSAVVHDLAQLWTEAERMIGRPLDPLDPDFLATLRSRSRHEP
jgi:hypothetical protein